MQLMNHQQFSIDYNNNLYFKTLKIAKKTNAMASQNQDYNK